MALVISALLFLAFVANVALGATLGERLLSDLGEMLVLAAAAVAFSIAVLTREAAQTARNKNDP